MKIKRLKTILYKQTNDDPDVVNGERVTITTCGCYNTITYYIDYVKYGLYKYGQTNYNLHNYNDLVTAYQKHGYKIIYQN